MRKSQYNTITFDSMADLAAYMTPDKCLHHGGNGTNWFGGATAEQAIKMLTTGDTSMVAEAERMLSKFDIHISTVGAQMDASVAGFAPCVPAFLGGSPESMFDMLECESNTAPLKVIVDPSSSAGIEVDVLRKRGATILAAVMALSATRPVQLELVCQLDCAEARCFLRPDRAGLHRYCAIRIPINSTPLDLPTACFGLSHQGFARRVAYGLAKHEYGSPLQWGVIPGVNMMAPREEATVRACIDLLGEDYDNTLFIPASFLQDPIVEEPLKWVSAVLAKYGQPELA